MRVHGREIIRRRTGLQEKSYSLYEPELREDFHHLCGYCGKSEDVTKKGFEIDHFVPQKKAANLVNCYDNLVYCCFTCNRKKGSKWPTDDTTIANDGNVGFCDPATEEYDKHLMRDEAGRIVSCSAVGDYMLTKAFQFNKRPTDTVWKAMRIIELKKQLRSKWATLNSEEKDQYMQIDEELESLLNYIFEKRE